MLYGGVEYLYAAPFAEALANNTAFKTWVLRRTIFAEVAEQALLLHEEMFAMRSRGTTIWWRSHFTEACRCDGCSGRETDVLAVFSAGAMRFALHLEVKRPGDTFNVKKRQAEAYPLRAQCWIEKTPKSVLPHSAATVGVLFSEMDRAFFKPHLVHFPAKITFEEADRAFPSLRFGLRSDS